MTKSKQEIKAPKHFMPTPGTVGKQLVNILTPAHVDASLCTCDSMAACRRIEELLRVFAGTATIPLQRVDVQLVIDTLKHAHDAFRGK